jgi:hypothetical protein
LISYPLYLWHWPLLVLGHTMMRLNDNRYENATAIIAIGLAFILSALTYQFIERPIRARQPVLPRAQINAALCMAMALIAVLGLGIVKGDGIPSRYPKKAQALVAPLVFGSDFPDFSQSMNSPGPLLVTLGDSLAFHLMPGLHELRKERAFRYQMIRWGKCGPDGYKKPVDPEDCLKSIEDIKTKFSLLKPDILLIARAWPGYNHVENISETIRFFQSIGVRKIILIGMVPYWREPPQILLYKSYLADPMHPIPDRLFGPKALEVDARLKDIAADLGVEYVSAYNVFCNENGCLVRLGSDAKDIFQIDRGHFSAAGSSFFVSHIANRIFD